MMEGGMMEDDGRREARKKVRREARKKVRREARRMDG